MRILEMFKDKRMQKSYAKPEHQRRTVSLNRGEIYSRMDEEEEKDSDGME